MSDEIVVVGMARTPLGGLQGGLANMTAADLGATAISAAIERSQISPESIDETLMGCVLPAGQGQAPARQASLAAGIPMSTGCTTINKMCGSAMKSVMLGMDIIKAGSANVVAAGGMESMSKAPYLLPKAREGMRLGHGQLLDHMFFDGLEDAYDKGKLMGVFAEATASKFEFTREAQDAYAIESLQRAKKAIEEGRFKQEIAPVTVKSRKGDTVVDTDEQPGNARIDKIPQLNPAFAKDGTVTAANSSSISDGAAALILMKASEADKRGLTPIARLLAHATNAHEPAWFTTAPVGAIQKVMKSVNWEIDDVDLFEVNEAFAVVTMAAMDQLKLPHEKVNVNGGACALGHPIGASGARIMVTLIAALQNKGLKRGVASLCIGGGEATAVALELV
ncbi:MAG: acetyl-CoA C-acyltransferase [Gammaproteobacteria bacterium]|nr:acetyl-CoA C-acyltransferase [Gammaproteobacteria bacterium]